MNQNIDANSIAMRMAKLPKEKKVQFRALLKEKNIDSWQLPIVAHTDTTEMNVLSNAQQRLWFIDHYEQGSAAYNLFTRLDIKGHVDINALKMALKALLERHSVLRSTYHLVDDKPMQQARVDYELPFWQASNVDDIETRSLQATEAVFDLENELPLRIYLFSNQSGQSRLVFVAHHIVFDAWSEALLIKEFSAYYAQFAEQGDVPTSPHSTLQYTDFAQWQQEWLDSEQAQSQLAYWQHQLAGSPACMPLPLDFERPDILSRSYQGAEVQLAVPDDVYQQLQSFVSEQGTTLYAVMQAGFSLLLNQLGAGADICLGTSVASRQRPELENMIGFLVNTLVIRHQLQDKQSFRQLVDQVSSTNRDALEHQALPFDLVVDKLNIPRGQPWSPLFQVLFVHRNVPRQTLQLGDLALTQVPHHSERARFDLTLRITEENNQLRLDLEYSCELFKQQTVVNLLAQYVQLLSHCINNVDSLIALTAEQSSNHASTSNGVKHDSLATTDDVNLAVMPEADQKIQSISAQLVTLFNEILDREVQLEDSFFALGGDSILSLQLVAKAKKMGLTLTPKLLFKAQTPLAIATSLVATFAPSAPEPTEVKRLAQLTPILETFRSLLGQPDLGEHDSFFAHGGDSILSLQLVAQLKKQGIKVTPKQVFSGQTAHSLALVLDTQAGHLPTPITKDSTQQAFSFMAPIQQWFFEQQLQHNDHWNQSILLSHVGELDRALFTQAVHQIVKKHPQLGMQYRLSTEGKYQQHYHPHDIALSAHHIEPQQLTEKISAVQGQLLLSRSALRIDLFSFNDQSEGRILMTAHHLVVDAVSWRVLVMQIWQHYQLLSHGLSDDLETDESDSYQTWVDDLMHWPAQKLQAARQYWSPLSSTPLSTQQQWVALPSQKAQTTENSANYLRDIAVVEVTLPATLTSKLTSQALAAYQLKIDELMLAALTLALSQWRDAQSILIELESHGRHHDELDLSQTVGWFTSRYPVLLTAIDGSSERLMREHILSIKDQLRCVPAHGQGFGVLKYLHNEVRELVTPSLVFNYLFRQ